MSDLIERNLELLEENQKLRQKLSKIAVLYTARINEKMGHFDWLQSTEAKFLEEIDRILNQK